MTRRKLRWPRGLRRKPGYKDLPTLHLKTAVGGWVYRALGSVD